MSQKENGLINSIVSKWLEQDLLTIIEKSKVLPIVVADFPDSVGRGNAMRIEKLKSMDLGGLKLHSLNQSHVNVEIDLVLHVAIDVYWVEYQSSQEVRNLIGECEEEFVSSTIYLDTPLHVSVDLDLLKEPPMVISHALRKVSGSATSVEYS
jgi:hypothetical protein